MLSEVVCRELGNCVEEVERKLTKTDQSYEKLFPMRVVSFDVVGNARSAIDVFENVGNVTRGFPRRSRV